MNFNQNNTTITLDSTLSAGSNLVFQKSKDSINFTNFIILIQIRICVTSMNYHL